MQKLQEIERLNVKLMEMEKLKLEKTELEKVVSNMQLLNNALE